MLPRYVRGTRTLYRYLWPGTNIDIPIQFQVIFVLHRYSRRARALPCTLPVQASAMTTILITGANRGLGLEFVRQILLSRPTLKIIATARNPKMFPSIQGADTSNLTILPLDLLNPESIANFPDHLTGRSLDVVIHNAGVSSSSHPDEPIMSAMREDMLRCFSTNVVGTLELARLLVPFLKSSEQKKMLFVSSKMGSLEATEIGGQAANEWTSSVSYRMSKAALNMSVRCLAAEIGGSMNSSGICFTAVHPGWVATDMGSAGGRVPPLTPEQSVQSMLGKVVDVMENETHNGSFRNYDGAVLPW